MMNLERFLPKSDVLAELFMYMILVEERKPILFVCKDKNENVYICSRYHADGIKCEWLVQKTTYTQLIELLTDKITIRDIFTTEHENLFVATLFAEGKNVIVRQFSLREIDDRVLPTAGYYMDVEDDEFEKELKILKAEEKNCLEFNSIRFQDSFCAIMRSFPMYITIPASEKKIARTEYYSSNQLVSILVS